jgi:hypothetical protein
MKILDEIIETARELPEELQTEVRDFARFLRENRVSRPRRRKLRMDWAGGLKDLRDKYTSVELQHKILDWWVEAALDGCPSAEAIRRELRAVGGADRNGSGTPIETLQAQEASLDTNRGTVTAVLLVFPARPADEENQALS